MSEHMKRYLASASRNPRMDAIMLLRDALRLPVDEGTRVLLSAIAYLVN